MTDTPEFMSQDREDLIVSFSGGETSAYMAYLLKQGDALNIHCIFANTGQEHEKTLEFVDRCDREWGLNVVWVEAVVHHGEKKASTHKIVNFETASRDGGPFEAVIQKYGIPNMAFPHCTRETKLSPIKSWVREVGLGSAKMAIGIRADEADRVSSNYKKNNLVYPLIGMGIRKRDVKKFWDGQSFSLGLQEHEGNCVWCWKKTDRKLFTLALDSPEIFDFPARMEQEYAFTGAGTTDEPRVFWRKNRSTKEILNLARSTHFVKFIEHDHLAQFELELDTPSGCGESCEVFADE